MTRLSVNINKIALIRNSRKGNLPDLIQVASDCERFGADGITVHPRPDQRHIRFSDIPLLKEVIQTEFNIEGYPSPEFIKMVCNIKPDQVTLVPDPPEALTSDCGWDIANHVNFLREIIMELKGQGIRVSLFLDPIPEMVERAKEIGSDRIEFYTGTFAANYKIDRQIAIENHVFAAKAACNSSIGINAGHDLNLDNLRFYKTNVEGLLEVSIGHGLVCDALYYGLENVIPMYKRLLS